MELKAFLKLRSPFAWKYQYYDRRRGPKITRGTGSISPNAAQTTFVVVCGAEFDQTVPNAATTCRLGWCRGFEQLGIPYILVSVYELSEKLPQLNNPICWISGSDYVYLTARNLKALKKRQHIVLVGERCRNARRYFNSLGFPDFSYSKELFKKILSSDPVAVFTISPESRFEFYEEWVLAGAKVVSLPLACDEALYHASATPCPEFASVELAFVGGYWGYKALQLDRYLKPWEQRLAVYGYSPWPYSGYRGQISEAKERLLYGAARVCPAINEPHVNALGINVNERIFKILGSGGLAAVDTTKTYRDWFTPEELFIPDTEGDFHAFVRNALSDPEKYRELRERGAQAVRNRHTYRHRALALLRVLGRRESCP